MSRVIRIIIDDWPSSATEAVPIMESAIAAQSLPGHHVVITGSRVSFMNEHGEDGVARLPWPAMIWLELKFDDLTPISFDLVVPTHIVQNDDEKNL